jgi:hypothetical protein
MNSFDYRFRFSGPQLCKLMRAHGVTIRALAARMGLTLKHIRAVRLRGVRGHAACDWYEAITGSLSPAMSAAYRSEVSR